MYVQTRKNLCKKHNDELGKSKSITSIEAFTIASKTQHPLRVINVNKSKVKHEINEY